MSRHLTRARKHATVNKKEQKSFIPELKTDLKKKGKAAKVDSGPGGGLFSSPPVGDESGSTIKTIKEAVGESTRTGHMLKPEARDSKASGAGSSPTSSSPTSSSPEALNANKNSNKTDAAPKSQQKDHQDNPKEQTPVKKQMKKNPNKTNGAPKQDQENQKDRSKGQGDLPQTPDQKQIKNNPNKTNAPPKQDQQNQKGNSKDPAPIQNLKGDKNPKARGKKAVVSLLKTTAPSPNSVIVASSTVKGVPDNKQLPESLENRKSIVRESLSKLKMVLDKELDTKAGAGASNTGSGTVKEAEDTLDRKQYSEEGDPEQIQAKKAQEEEHCLLWMDKAINLALFNISILVLIAALMTAFACYIFVQLPFVVYSVHLLTEVFLISDKLIEENGFSRPATLRILTPLPLVVLIMYGTILYSIYLTQYPKRSKALIYTRNCVFVILESYFFITALSYGIEIIPVKDRLTAFHKKDLKGITVSKTVFEHYQPKTPVPLYFLNRSQEYFGCCGFFNKAEWQKTYPDKYNNMTNGPTWPLSCCDEELSGTACYGPVMETVHYTRRNDEDDEEPDEFTEFSKDRLYENNCFSHEKTLTTTVISMICFLTVAFMLLSTWNVVIFIRLSRLCVEKNLEPRQKEQYIDFF